MIKKHKLHNVTIQWNDTDDIEDCCVSVGEGIDQSTDHQCVFSFTKSEWSNVKSKVRKNGKVDCGDFCITKINS